MPNTNEEAFTKMTKEEQEQFAATLFSILALQMNIWADILKKSQKVPPPIKHNKVSKRSRRCT